jgi:hypothetical protein
MAQGLLPTGIGVFGLRGIAGYCQTGAILNLLMCLACLPARGLLNCLMAFGLETHTTQLNESPK